MIKGPPDWISISCTGQYARVASERNPTSASASCYSPNRARRRSEGGGLRCAETRSISHRPEMGSRGGWYLQGNHPRVAQCDAGFRPSTVQPLRKQTFKSKGFGQHVQCAHLGFGTLGTSSKHQPHKPANEPEIHFLACPRETGKFDRGWEPRANQERQPPGTACWRGTVESPKVAD